jgi:hypothetical protein
MVGQTLKSLPRHGNSVDDFSRIPQDHLLRALTSVHVLNPKINTNFHIVVVVKAALAQILWMDFEPESSSNLRG